MAFDGEGYYYVDEDKKVVRVTGLSGMVTAYNRDRHIAQDEIGPAAISTVCLGCDSRTSVEDGPPVIFETMVFWAGHFLDRTQVRYETYEAALDGHDTACSIVRMALKQLEEKS